MSCFVKVVYLHTSLYDILLFYDYDYFSISETCHVLSRCSIMSNVSMYVWFRVFVYILSPVWCPFKSLVTYIKSMYIQHIQVEWKFHSSGSTWINFHLNQLPWSWTEPTWFVAPLFEPPTVGYILSIDVILLHNPTYYPFINAPVYMSLGEMTSAENVWRTLPVYSWWTVKVTVVICCVVQLWTARDIGLVILTWSERFVIEEHDVLS